MINNDDIDIAFWQPTGTSSNLKIKDSRILELNKQALRTDIKGEKHNSFHKKKL